MGSPRASRALYGPSRAVLEAALGRSSVPWDRPESDPGLDRAVGAPEAECKCGEGLFYENIRQRI
eukprot:7390785-Pyramimonas_sp.AAC.1